MSSEAGTKVKYVAEISPVREVWLLGTADLAFWAEHLKGQALSPAEFEGRARILLSAIEARYMGVRFRELCISVFVRGEHAGAGDDQLFLAQGFHSSRLFAWFERTLFSTPYEHGEIELNAAVPASVRLVEGGEAVFRAEMTPDRSGELRSPIRCGDE